MPPIFVTEGSKLTYGDVGTYMREMLNFFSDQKGFYLFGNSANVAPTLFILIRSPWTM
jgi:hypothetical protein